MLLLALLLLRLSGVALDLIVVLAAVLAGVLTVDVIEDFFVSAGVVDAGEGLKGFSKTG